MANVLVLIPVEERHKKLLEEAAPGWRFTYTTPQKATEEETLAADCIIGNPSRRYLAKSERLRWVQLHTAGAEPYLEPGALPEGVTLTNSTGAYGLALSEHMLGLTFLLMKKLHRYRDNQLKSDWKDEGTVSGIHGSTVLVVGLGDIGGDYAKKMKALGATVIGIRRTKAEKPEWLDELHQTEDLDELLPRADVIALSLPGTSDTAKMFDSRRLSLMKKGAILLNVGRGGAVDTEALCDALASGHLGGAGLDVTDPEPLPGDHRLWREPNAVITPHIAGLFHLPETFERIVRIAAGNLAAFYANQPLTHLVDFKTGYRAL